MRMTERTKPITEAAAEFLANKRIAVTGVSRSPETHGSNVVYRRLRERGYETFAINPNADEVEGDHSYPDLKSIPGGVSAVVIGTRPDRAEATVRECVELGIKHVWMHRSMGAGSVSKSASDYGRTHGLKVIPGGCLDVRAGGRRRSQDHEICLHAHESCAEKGPAMSEAETHRSISGPLESPRRS